MTIEATAAHVETTTALPSLRPLVWQKNPLALQQMPAAMPAGTNHEDIPLSAIMNPILHTVADKLQTHSPFQTKNLWWIPDPLLLRYWQNSLID